MGKQLKPDAAQSRINNTQQAMSLKGNLGSLTFKSIPIMGPQANYAHYAKLATNNIEQIYSAGKKIIDNKISSIMQNELKKHSDQLNSSPVTPTNIPSQQQFAVGPSLGNPVAMHLSDLENARNFFMKYVQYYSVLKDAVLDWSKWTKAVSDFYDTEYVSSIKKDLIEVNYDDKDGVSRNNLYNTLRTYFSVIENNEHLYGQKAKVVESIETSRRQNAGKAKNCVDSIVQSAKANNQDKTIGVLKDRITQCTNAASTAETNRKLLQEYLNNAFLSKFTITFNPATGVLKCR